MLKRSFLACSAACLLLSAASAGDPAVIVRVKPVDDLLSTASYFAKIADKAEEAKQFLGIVESMKDESGIEGIDTTRPMGMTLEVTPGAFDSIPLVLVPVSDEERFLNFLGRFDVVPEKGDDGVYTVKRDELPVPLHFRFAQKYACITAMNKDNIDPKKLPKIAEVLKGDGVDLIAVETHIDRIPKEVRDLALGQLELLTADARDNDTADTEAQEKLRLAALDSALGGVKMLLTQGGRLQLGLGVDQKTDELSFGFEFAPLKGTELAKRISGMAGKKSAVLGGVHEVGTALAAGYNMELPDSIQKELGPVVDELFEMLSDQAAVGAPVDVRLVENLLDAVAPTAKAGVFDLGLGMNGPNKDGKFVLVAGFRVQQGKKVEAAVKKLVGDLPGEIQQMVKFDAAKLGGATLHRITLPPEALQDEEAKAIFGDEIEILLATAEDRFFVAMGSAPEEVLKGALKAKKGAFPLESQRVSIKAISALMDGDNPGASKVASEHFSGSQQGMIKSTMTGGKTLRSRVTVSTSVIGFFVKLEELSSSLD